VDGADRVGGADGQHGEGAPAGGAGVGEILQGVTGGLDDAAKPGAGGAAPLVGVAGAARGAGEDGLPHPGWDGSGVTGGAEAEERAVEVGRLRRRVAGAVVPAVPDAEGRLVPLDVAGAVEAVWAVAADGGAGLGGEGVVGWDVGAEDPGLKHGAGLGVAGALGEAGGDDDDRSAVEHGRALVEDAPVGVGHEP